MTHWQPFADSSCFYFIADSKPDEIVKPEHPDTVFCTAFVSTSSSFKGVKNPDLPWLKQYKDSESLEESLFILRNLFREILDGNFFDLYIWIMSSTYSTIDRNGTNFIRGLERELDSVKVKGEHVWHRRNRFSINKAKMLVWYNFCLCQIAVRLVDEVKRWNLNKGSILIDRLGDSDQRVMDFMGMVMHESSMNKLWRRCAEDYDEKPKWIGVEYATTINSEGKLIPPTNSMQFALVDWIVLAAYAVNNGIENRDPAFQAELEHLIRTLDRLGIIKGIHFEGNITWN